MDCFKDNRDTLLRRVRDANPRDTQHLLDAFEEMLRALPEPDEDYYYCSTPDCEASEKCEMLVLGIESSLRAALRELG